MLIEKSKSRTHQILSREQNRLVKDSLKQFLGYGLIQNNPTTSRPKQNLSFLKDALNLKVLESELLA